MRPSRLWQRGVVLFGAVVHTGSLAQVTLDGTLGPAGPLAGPDYAITADLGRQVGGNLFHSFGRFAIQPGESATFSGPHSVHNIIGRVTGGQVSTIDGALRSTIAGASLYLLNPAGVLFGENAVLDVPGSVHISTADYLQLGEGGRFDARHPGRSVLTVAPVEAFGFLGGEAGAVRFMGSDLDFAPGQRVTLSAGDIEIRDSFIGVAGGELALTALGAAPGVIPVHGTFAGAAHGAVTVDRSFLNLIGEGGGGVSIRGGDLRMTDSLLYADHIGAADAARRVDIAVESLAMDNSAITSDALGEGRAGEVRVAVTGTVRVADSLIVSDAYAAGAAGNVIVSADQLWVTGPGSSIGSQVHDDVTGAGGNVDLDVADNLSLLDGGYIRADTYGMGDAGNVTVRARNVLIDRQGATFTGISSEALVGAGSGGDVTVVVAGILQVVNGGAISTSTFARGDAGSVTVTAGNLLVDGQGSEWFTGIASQTNPGATGAGGYVDLEVAETLALLNGGTISTGTFTQSDAGTVTIRAGTLLVDGQGSAGLTSISSSANPDSTGDGGDVRLTVADTLSLRNGGRISVGSLGAGNAGDLTVATPRLMLADGSEIRAISAHATGGNLTVDAAHLKLLDGSQISSSVFGDALSDGGNVTLNSTNIVALNGSAVTARANQGLGGNITVNAEVFLHDAPGTEQVLNASSNVQGNDGTVELNAPTTDLSGSLVGLETSYLDAAAQLIPQCGAIAPEKRSRFQVRGRGAWAPAPAQVLLGRGEHCGPLAPVAFAETPVTRARPPPAPGAAFGFNDR